MPSPAPLVELHAEEPPSDIQHLAVELTSAADQAFVPRSLAVAIRASIQVQSLRLATPGAAQCQTLLCGTADLSL